MSTRTQYYVAASLDGFIAESDDGLEWLMGYDDGSGSPAGDDAPTEPEPGSYEEFIAGVGALVMGARTYDVLVGGLVETWPYKGLPTYVYAHHERPLMEGADDVRFVEGTVAERHDEMVAAADGRNLWVVGGGALASQYLDAGLLDDVLLAVVPVWLGSGLPLFAHRHDEGMRIVGMRQFRSGLAQLHLQPKR